MRYLARYIDFTVISGRIVYFECYENLDAKNLYKAYGYCQAVISYQYMHEIAKYFIGKQIGNKIIKHIQISKDIENMEDKVRLYTDGDINKDKPDSFDLNRRRRRNCISLQENVFLYKGGNFDG